MPCYANFPGKVPGFYGTLLHAFRLFYARSDDYLLVALNSSICALAGTAVAMATLQVFFHNFGRIGQLDLRMGQGEKCLTDGCRSGIPSRSYGGGYSLRSA